MSVLKKLDTHTPKITKSLDGNDEPGNSRTKIICNVDKSSIDNIPIGLLNKIHVRTASVESKTDDSTSCTCQKKVCTCTFHKDRKKESDYYVPGKSKFCNCVSKTDSKKSTSKKKGSKCMKELLQDDKGRKIKLGGSKPGQLKTNASKSGASKTKTPKGYEETKTKKKKARNLKLPKTDHSETKTFSTDKSKTDDSKTDTSKTKKRKGNKETKSKKKSVPSLNLDVSAFDSPKPMKTKLFSTDELLIDDSKTDTPRIITHQVKTEKKSRKVKRASSVNLDFLKPDHYQADNYGLRKFSKEQGKADYFKTGTSKQKTDTKDDLTLDQSPEITTKKKPKPDDDDDDFPFPPITPDERVLPQVKYKRK